MFDSSEFDESTEQFISKFPKTDLNFFEKQLISLEPWNKTSTIPRESNNEPEKVYAPRKTHSMDYNPFPYALISSKTRPIQQSRHQVTLSTFTVCLESERGVSPIFKPRKKKYTISGAKNKKQKAEQSSSFEAEQMAVFDKVKEVRGLPNSLKHTDLLKLKQERQKKIKQLLSKKQVPSNRQNLQMMKTGKFDKLTLSINPNSSSESSLMGSTFLHHQKPKRPSFVGIRLMHLQKPKPNI